MLLMSDPIVFVFESVEAARAAVRRLADAGIFTRQLELDADLERSGIKPSGMGKPCVLRIQLAPGLDERRLTELIRGNGRLLPVPQAESNQLNLELECLRIEKAWRSMMAQDVPMSVAAATAFHQAHRNTRAIVGRKDYEDALAIAASVLSRIVPVYTIGAITRKRVQVPVNLLTHRFALGATQLRAIQGEAVIEPLFVRRADLVSALSIITRAGLPFGFAVMPGSESNENKRQPGVAGRTLHRE